MMYKIGKELEGKFQGLRTLFIKGSGKFEEIETILAKYRNIQQLYFGAFSQSKIKDWNIIKKSLTLGKIITAEICYKDINTVPDDIWNDERIHKVVTFFPRKKTYVNVTLKIEDETGIYCYPSYIYNDYSGYEQDVTVR